LTDLRIIDSLHFGLITFGAKTLSYALGPGILFPPRALKLSKNPTCPVYYGFSKNKKNAKAGFKKFTCDAFFRIFAPFPHAFT